MESFQQFFKQSLMLTIAQMKSRYRKTLAGFFWVVLNPMISFGIQSFVFKRVLNLQIDNYYLYLASGLIPWIFITQSIFMTTTIFLTNGELLKSFQINPLVLILSSLLDNFFNFMFALVMIVLPISIKYHVDLSGIVFLPVASILLVTGVFCLSWLAANLQVFFRDLQYILNFMFTVLFFITPIFFLKESFPENTRFLADYNPLYILIEPFRICLYEFNFQTFLISLSKSAVLCILLFTTSYYYWKKKRDELYLQI